MAVLALTAGPTGGGAAWTRTGTLSATFHVGGLKPSFIYILAHLAEPGNARRGWLRLRRNGDIFLAKRSKIVKKVKTGQTFLFCKGGPGKVEKNGQMFTFWSKVTIWPFLVKSDGFDHFSKPSF